MMHEWDETVSYVEDEGGHVIPMDGEERMDTNNPVLFQLNVSMDNAAFEWPHDLSRILRELADKLENRQIYPGMEGPLRDINGNTVGQWEVVEDNE